MALSPLTLNDSAPQAIQALAAGMTSVKTVTGNRVGHGSFTLNANATAGDTFTIGPVTLTAVASGAVAGQFNIGATASDTANNLETAFMTLVSPVEDGIDEADGTGGTMKLPWWMIVGANSNVVSVYCDYAQPIRQGVTLSASGNVTVEAFDRGSYAAPIKPDAGLIRLVTTAAGANLSAWGYDDMEFTLLPGEEGQQITVTLATKGTNADAVLAYSGTSVTLTAANAYRTFKFLNGAWRVLYSS
jgi:hypothetical protein